MATDIRAQIRADKELAQTKIQEARANGMKIIEFAPQSEEPAEVIRFCLTEIKQGERILVALPETFTHLDGSSTIRQLDVGMLVEEFTTPEFAEDRDGDDVLIQALPDDIFVALRNSEGKIIVDICHM